MKTKYNFHSHTFCIFEARELSEIVNKKPNFVSKSGSSYFFTKNGVFRLSNHWSRVANCLWRLSGDENATSKTKLGYAKWSDFYQINDSEKLFFIAIDFDSNSAHYFHKNSPNFSEGKLLRNANETAKILKKIRVLLKDNSWLDYYDVRDIQKTKTEILSEFANSNLSFVTIKSNYFSTI